MEPYRPHFADAGSRFPITYALAKRVLTLPTGTVVSAQEVGIPFVTSFGWSSHGEEIRKELERVSRR
jgi:hypothetical protein